MKKVFSLIFILVCPAVYSATANKLSSSHISTKPKKAAVKKENTTKKKSPSAVALYKMPKVQALIKTGGLNRRIQIVGITSTDIQYAAGLKMKTIPIKSLEFINFEVGYSPYTVRVLEAQKKYIEAASEIIKKFTPAFKYISLPDNNIIDPLYDAGFLFLNAALNFDNKLSPSYDRKKAVQAYTNAYKVFRKIVSVKWSSDTQLADIYSIYCILRMDKYDIAEKKLEEFGEPEPGTQGYGIYWLADAIIKFQRGKKEEALDSAVKSIVFDCRNTYSFPHALLLSAFCYEDLLDNYRARDTYYETARLFEGTPEGEIAYKSLTFIREKKLTDEKEEIGLEKVFFDSAEDVNKKVDDYIAEAERRRKLLEKREKAEADKKKSSKK